MQTSSHKKGGPWGPGGGGSVVSTNMSLVQSLYLKMQVWWHTLTVPALLSSIPVA